MSVKENAVLLGPYTRKQKLYLETEDGVAMEGEFVRFNPSKTSILLHHVELVPFDGRTFQQYCAVVSELVCLRPLEIPQKSVNSPESDETEKPATVTEIFKDLVLPEMDNSENTQQRAAKFEARKENHVEETNGIYEALKLKANGYIIVDKPGPMLQSAMEDIGKRSVLGLSGHGAEKGRLDRLSLLAVATDSAVYILDVQALGKQVLTKTLIQALESKTVQKVTCDCRYLSDCLYYTHHIRLANVYDVQAADCVMLRCRKGSFPNRGRSLEELVSQYLGLPAALLADKTNIKNYKVWYQRPLQEDCYSFASWQVVFLPHLRTAIDKAFQNLMRNSMDVYVSHIRKMGRSDAVETMATRRQIPVALLDAPFVRDA